MVAPGAMVGTGSRNIAMVAMDENDEVINNFSVYIYIYVVIGSTLVASVPTSAMRSPPFSMAS